MDPAIKHWLGLWDYLDHNFWGFCQWAVAELKPEEVGWQPAPQVASIGWNLQHLGEMLDHYLAHVFAQAKPVQRTPLKTMRSGSLDDGRYCDLQAIADYHRQVRPAYRTFLSQLTATDLDRPLGGGRTRTWDWAVGHIAEHESYHLGKCMLLRNLLPSRLLSRG
jgi:uncharacterized damage-inducible protein DinB